jgi:hypothetical protein
MNVLVPKNVLFYLKKRLHLCIVVTFRDLELGIWDLVEGRNGHFFFGRIFFASFPRTVPRTGSNG